MKMSTENGDNPTYPKDPQLELDYSPSKWSHRINAEEIVQSHIEVLTTMSNAVTSDPNISCQLGVQYGSSEKQKMDIFKPKDPAASSGPVFVYIHGGYWQLLSREMSSFMVSPLVGAGATVVTVGYDLAPQANMDTIVGQVVAATSKILDLARSWGSRGVYLSGHSAGGHLAAMVLSHPEIDGEQLIKGAMLISSVFQLQPIVTTYINDPIQMDLECAKRNSPQELVHKLPLGVEVLVAVGDHDPPKFREQSALYHETITKLKINSEYMEVKDSDHFNVVEQLVDPEYELTKKIKEMMRL